MTDSKYKNLLKKLFEKLIKKYTERRVVLFVVVKGKEAKEIVKGLTRDQLSTRQSPTQQGPLKPQKTILSKQSQTWETCTCDDIKVEKNGV